MRSFINTNGNARIVSMMVGEYITVHLQYSYFLFGMDMDSPQIYEADYWCNETTIIHIVFIHVPKHISGGWGHCPYICSHGCHINVLGTLAVQWGLDKMCRYKWHLLSNEESMPVSPPPVVRELIECVCVCVGCMRKPWLREVCYEGYVDIVHVVHWTADVHMSHRSRSSGNK